MSFPNYAHIANAPITQLKRGDLIESRLGENVVEAVREEGFKPIVTINTTHGFIVCTAEQQWLDLNDTWIATADLLPGKLLQYYRYGPVLINSLGLIKPDRVYTLTTEKGEYVAAGHVTRG